MRGLVSATVAIRYGLCPCALTRDYVVMETWETLSLCVYIVVTRTMTLTRDCDVRMFYVCNY